MKFAPLVLSVVAAAFLYAPAAVAGPEGAPVPDISPAPVADLSAGDVDQTFDAAPSKRLTLGERLMLQNAVCVLWHNSMKQDPAPVESIDLMGTDAPDHIFISPSAGCYFEDGVWVLEGLIRQMEPDSTGIERIPTVQYFNVRFEPKPDGSFFPAAIRFDSVGGF